MSSYRSVNVFIEVSRRGSVRTPGKSDAVFETSKFFFFFFFFFAKSYPDHFAQFLL